MKLSTDFWNVQTGLVLVGDDGTLRFTRTGRVRYAPLFARYGFALDHVKTVERFCEVLHHVNTGELEANTIALQKVLNDPLAGEFEREIVRRALPATDHTE